MRSLSDLAAELRLVEAEITDAYWTYTRTARGKPPCLAVPHAYRRRRELVAERRAISMSNGDGTPNLITTSGRESMTLDERRALIASEAAWFETWAESAERGQSGATIHDRRNLVGTMRAAAIVYPGQRVFEELSRIECRVLAWRRGGHAEYKRVCRAQLDASTARV